MSQSQKQTVTENIEMIRLQVVLFLLYLSFLSEFNFLLKMIILFKNLISDSFSICNNFLSEREQSTRGRSSVVEGSGFFWLDQIWAQLFISFLSTETSQQIHYQGDWNGRECAPAEGSGGDEQEVRISWILFPIPVTPYCNVVGVQGGGRLVAAAARGAEEDDQPHPRDEHLQLFKVGSAGSLFVRDSSGWCVYMLTGNPCTKPRRRSEIWRRTMLSWGVFWLIELIIYGFYMVLFMKGKQRETS